MYHNGTKSALAKLNVLSQACDASMYLGEGQSQLQGSGVYSWRKQGPSFPYRVHVENPADLLGLPLHLLWPRGCPKDCSYHHFPRLIATRFLVPPPTLHEFLGPFKPGTSVHDDTCMLGNVLAVGIHVGQHATYLYYFCQSIIESKKFIVACLPIIPIARLVNARRKHWQDYCSSRHAIRRVPFRDLNVRTKRYAFLLAPGGQDVDARCCVDGLHVYNKKHHT